MLEQYKLSDVSCWSLATSLRPAAGGVVKQEKLRYLLQIRLGEFAFGLLQRKTNRSSNNRICNERLLLRRRQRQTQTQSQQSYECTFHFFFFFFTFTSSHGFAPTRLAQAS